MINQEELATRADLEKLSTRLDASFDRLDKRLVIMQWIGFIFLAINGSLTGMLLWTMARLIAR